MFGRKPRSQTLYDAEVLLQRRKDVQQHEYNSRYKRIRSAVYQFLDHPLAANSTLYHFAVFFFVLLAVILGATAETLENHWMIEVYSRMESFLLVFFVIEFAIRLWSIEADAKYIGWRGKLKYMRSTVCIADMIIILVTFIMRVMEKRYVSKNMMDYLRFIQILRLFHIDRQMTTWRLIKNMIMISKMELFSAYYITFFIFLVLANTVFLLENTDFHQISNQFFNVTEGVPKRTTTMPTLADAWWFSAVTILTIGYGDIVPAYWTTKLVVCLLGFLAFCTFVTASTQISVGLTLMMEEDNKQEYKKKLRNTSAGVIQCWYRYHVATRIFNDQSSLKSAHFKHVCYKLYLTNERLQRIRDEEKKRQHKMSKKRKSSPAIKTSYFNSSVVNEEQPAWIHSLRYKVTPQVMTAAGIMDTSIVPRPPPPPPPQPQHKSSTNSFRRFMSLPFSYSCEVDDYNPPAEVMSLPDTKFTHHHRSSTDTALSSSFDSDTDHNGDLLRHQHDKYSSADINEVDERILIRYQPLLRFLNFLLFRQFVKKFKRLRKSDKMLQMEAEMAEHDHEREQNLRELEDTLGSLIGKPSRSYLGQIDEKLTVNERVNLFEKRLAGMEEKLETIETLSGSIMKFMQEKALLTPPSPTVAPTLSRRTSRLQRQRTIDIATTTLHEYSENDDEEDEPDS
ncbi:unnamed protein product [Auanema sp. JU1783]|nr:unnamed protein product [Auanema sp. JU1783]